MIITSTSLSHKKNLIRHFAPGFIGMVIFSVLLLVSTDIALWLWALITALLMLGGLTLHGHSLDHKVIQWVELTEEAINIKGHVKDVPFTAHLPLKDIRASLVMLRENKSRKDFYIRLETMEDKQCINLNRHWNYEKLINFYKALKKAQGEPLTLTDKDYLKQMRDLAMGLAQGYNS